MDVLLESLVLYSMTLLEERDEVSMCYYSMQSALNIIACTDLLPSGDPGLGKTLTAEAAAEHLKRPLYSVWQPVLCLVKCLLMI